MADGLPTVFDDVFKIYLQRVESFQLTGLTREEILEDLTTKLELAKGRFVSADDITLDLVNSKFNRELTDIEKDILALWMISEWVKPKFFSEEKTETRMTAKEYNSPSNAPLLNQLRAMKQEVDREANRYTTIYGYKKKKKVPINE